MNLGTVPIDRIASITGCSKSTVYAALKDSEDKAISLQEATALVLSFRPDEGITTNKSGDKFLETDMQPVMLGWGSAIDEAAGKPDGRGSP